MKKKIMKLIAFVLALTLILPIVPAKAAVATKLNATSVTITGVGTKYVLTLTAPTGSKSTWKSSKSSIASVTANGVVSAKKKGTVTITCSVKTGKVTKNLTCKVIVKVPSKAIRFSNAIIDKEYNAHILSIGTPYDFNSTLISTSNKSSSSDVRRFYIKDSSIATVNAKTGVVTPVKEGTTYLTICAGINETAALSADNTVFSTIGIKVVAPTISVSSCSLSHGKELVIKFSKPMNTSTLIGSNKALNSNISITPKTTNSTASSDLGIITATMSDDLQTLYIHPTNAFNGTYNVALSSNILSSTGVALKPYNNDLELKDTIAPTFAGTSTDETGMIAYIKFSEPIDITKLVATDPKKSNNTVPLMSSIFTTASNYKLSADKMTLSIDLSNISVSDKNTEISVKLYGIVDLAGNITEPYPLTVYMSTDTSSKPQAVCQSVVRNGNSLVATFDRSIQSPGYAIVNSTYVNGTVNTSNKKEIIYNLLNQGLTTLTGSIPVTLTNFQGYNAPLTPSTQFSTSVSFATPAVLPVLMTSSLTTKAINGVKQQVLTLTYDKNVTLKSSTGSLSATSSIDGIIGASTGYNYSATVTDAVVTVILTGSFVELGTYTFTIPSEFVKDIYNNNSGQISVSTVKISGDSQVLPAPVSIQLDSTNSSTIYVTFNNMLDLDSAQNVNNYKISGFTIGSATVIANSYTSPAIVELKLMTGSTVAEGIPYQIIISGIKGYKSSYTAMNTYKDMVYISNNKTLTATCIGIALTKKIILSCSSSISNSSVVNYTFTSAGKTLTLKNAPIILGSTITFEFTDTITAGSVVSMNPEMNNSIVDMSNKKVLNQSYSVTMN